MTPTWSTACTDWKDRLLAGTSPIPFDPLFPQEAAASLELFKSLTLVDVTGRPTFGQAARPWILDFVAAIFGSYDPDTGAQLIRNFFLLISKKNGKSTLAAGIMIAALVRNWRQSGEFYILAPTKEVADNSYNPARDMVKAHPVLSTLLKPSAGRVIEHRNTGALLKVIAADSETVTGKKTIGLLVDELHVFGKRANAESVLLEITGGLASRPEGFVIYLSTMADAPPSGVFAQKLEEFRAIRDGKIAVPTSLPVLYEYPPELLKDEVFRRPENWGITNPNLGVSVSESYLAEKLAEAERAGRAQLAGFFAKHLNVQIGNSLRADGWVGAEIWPRGLDTTLTLDELLARSEVVTIGIDGGGLDDMLGVAVVGRDRETGRWLAWVHGLVSTIGVWRRKANATDYLRFVRCGDLTIFCFGHESESEIADDPAVAELLAYTAPFDPFADKLPPDIRYVVDLVERVRELGLLAKVGVDAAGIGAIIDALAEIGVTQDADLLDAVRQGIGLMGAIKTTERMLADRRFRHGGQAMLDWCVGNLIVVLTPTAMRVARDEGGLGKIDPAMAMFNAVALMCMNPEPQGSVYTGARGLVVFG
jgi:phage terminase large subunit-like protein